MNRSILVLLVVVYLMPAAYASGDGIGRRNKFDITNPFDTKWKDNAKLGIPGLMGGGDAAISYTSRGIYLLLAPSISAIVNEDIMKNDNWEVLNGFGFNIEVGYLLKFNKWIGVGAGIGYSSYSTEIKSDVQGFQIPDTLEDDDRDKYLKTFKTSEISEKTQIGYFDIPVFIEISNTNIDKLGFYVRLGVKASIPITSNFDGSGTVSYTGWYDEYNVELYGIPELEFYSGKPIYEKNNVELNTVSFSAFLSAGLSFPISNYLIIKVGANANFGLTEISSFKATDYDTTGYDGDYSKLLGNPSKTTTRAFGMELGLIYNLRLY